MDKWIGKIEQIVQKVDALTKTRVISALLMLYEGIMLLIRPHMAARGMAQGICIGIALAAVGFLADAVQKKQVKSGVLSGIILIMCVYFYFSPDGISMYLRYVMALIILIVGLSHLFQIARLNKLLLMNNGALQALRETARKNSMTEAVHKTFEEQVDKRIHSTMNLFERLNRGKITAWISAIVMTGVGLFLFIYPVEGNAVMTLICGVSLIGASSVTLWSEYKARKKHS